MGFAHGTVFIEVSRSDPTRSRHGRNLTEHGPRIGAASGSSISSVANSMGPRGQTLGGSNYGRTVFNGGVRRGSNGNRVGQSFQFCHRCALCCSVVSRCGLLLVDAWRASRSHAGSMCTGLWRCFPRVGAGGFIRKLERISGEAASVLRYL